MATSLSMDDIIKYVQNCHFPVDYQGLLQCARSNNAPDEVMLSLKETRDASSNHIFSSIDQVRGEIERHREHISH